MATRTDSTTSATTIVDAPPAEVFAFLRDPANHAIISGDGSVRGHVRGPRQLSLGDRFGMDMKLGVPYRISSKVVEYEQDQRIAWAHLGRHRWRWELAPTDDGGTEVTETFDLSTALFPPALRLLGFPARHDRNVERSVANLAEHFAGSRSVTS